MAADADPRLALAYQESVRALTVQSGVLDELRSRTGVLLAAASVASAFLGAQTLTARHALSGLPLVALISFGSVVVLCIYVLLPGSGWAFTQDAKSLVTDYVSADQSLDFMHESMAIEGAECRAANEERLRWRFLGFRLACLALCADIALWLLALAER